MELRFQAKKRLTAAGSGDFALDAAFTCGPGFAVLMGPSGAGKTTILRLIAGIVPPDSGSITLGGTTYFDSQRGIDLAIQKRRVGFVFQDYALFPHMTARENVAYGVKAVSRGERAEAVADAMRLFRIEHRADRLPGEMSGGEQQRVALARAIASDPAIVLLDEPLSAVDLELRGQLLDEIANAQKSVGVPFIYVTHNGAEADRLGGTRIMLDAGRVASFDRPDAVTG